MMNIPLSLRLILISFLLNLAIETSVVFMPLYAQSVGSSNFQIGLITAAFWSASFLSSMVFGRQSDVHGRLQFIRAGLGLSAIAYLSQFVSHTAYTLLAARALIGFCVGIVSAALMAYTYENQKKIGKFVSLGTLGFLIGATLAAVLRDYPILLLVSATASVIAFLISLTLPKGQDNRIQIALFPLPLIKTNLKVYFPLFLRHSGAFATFAILPLYLASIGASKSWIAIFDGINTGTQFLLMLFIERFNPVTLFHTGLILSALVFLGYGLANNFLQILPVQIFLGISFATMYMGALSYLLRKHKERGTVSGLVFSSMNSAASVGPFMGGVISQFWGFAPVMFFGSGMAFIGFLSSLGLKAKKEIKAGGV